jgi:hypothetical protein
MDIGEAGVKALLQTQFFARAQKRPHLFFNDDFGHPAFQNVINI